MLLPPSTSPPLDVMNNVTRTPSGRIRRIPSDLMKRVRCSYPGCCLAVIPSNFARHWKFKHADLLQPPIESLTVIRGENSSDSGDVPLPISLKRSTTPPPLLLLPLSSSLPPPSLSPLPFHPSQTSSSSSPPPPPNAHYSTDSLRNDGKERKRAKQRNYLCAECGRPLIGSNFARHWSSKHSDVPMPNLHDLEMEPLSEGEEDDGSFSPTPPVSMAPKPAKKRKVICSECQMPMIASNFSRHWMSRHSLIPMPHVTSLDYIDASQIQEHVPTRNEEPDDEEFEDVEEIVEDEEEEEEEEPEEEASDSVGAARNECSLEIEQRPPREKEVHPEPVATFSSTPIYTGGKRHKKVYCSECNMPMLCNNFRRHFQRRHGHMMDSMPSIHTLEIVSDEDYDKTGPFIPSPIVSHTNGTNGREPSKNSSPAKTIKRKVICPACRMPMIGSNFGRHWTSKHGEMEQPLLQHLEVSTMNDQVGGNDEAETLVCEPLLFGPDTSDDDNEESDAHRRHFDESQTCGQCSFHTVDRTEMSIHMRKTGHGRVAKVDRRPSFEEPDKKKMKKVWKKKLICPECNLQTISSNFARHWNAKHGPDPAPNLSDLEVITIDDPGFHDLSSSKVINEVQHGREDAQTDESMDELQFNDLESEEFYEEVEEDLDDVEEEAQVAATVMEDDDEEEDEEEEPQSEELHEQMEEVEDEEEIVEEVGGDDEEEEEETIVESESVKSLINNKINCNFDINSLLEDDDDDDLSEEASEDDSVLPPPKLSYTLL